MLRNIVGSPRVREDRGLSDSRPVNPIHGFCSIRSRLRNGFRLVPLKGIRATGMNCFVPIFERRSRSDVVELSSSVPACFVAAAEREHQDSMLQRAHASD
ncbi:hypothetical protein SISSUDRAFT_1054865 [Sistotremastrum suecicum HHB10207 ss-3]|uniref:Uncharacterized protein n=1 Tax=Sistotremastrum suecicum HHB10207 ss-3 TaxID=1314776 RepID=A0A165Y707_9AGAM|nr:hypothetical protein SISSUDRAFT_1054865 [Sistotremastrum suecicum HHB10207 ss-3]